MYEMRFANSIGFYVAELPFASFFIDARSARNVGSNRNLQEWQDCQVIACKWHPLSLKLEWIILAL